MPNPATIHAVLVEEGRKRGLPKHWRNDLLIHDLTDLTERQTDHFLWCLRTCGTHLINLSRETMKTDDNNNARGLFRALNGFGDPEMYWYEFCDHRLREVTKAQAEEICSDATMEAHRWQTAKRREELRETIR